MSGSDLFIVDNSDGDWKVLRYLEDFCEISEKIDIATGYFEIGALLSLKDKWQGVDKIRILMGDEVSKRTANAVREAFENIESRLDESLEKEKIKNDFLDGVSSVVQALADGRIECRVFKKDKFHAKTYITHSRLEVVGSTALVGSSNFTHPGLAENVELNVQIRGPEVGLLQDWYENHWEQAEECTPEILRVIERQSKDYMPFDVWLKSISEFLKGHESTVDEWERNESVIFPILAKYQQDGYKAMLKRGDKYGGAFLCDGVGLGKTFVGLMLIERFLMYKGNRKSVALFVPKAAREAVWEQELKKYLPKTLGGFLPFKIFNHTDLHREKLADELENVRTEADIIIIDEAHHFRNRGRKGVTDFEKRSRYFRMLELTEGKKVFLLTATPINNQLLDLKHLIDLFAREDPSYFAGTLGIHSLDAHFRNLEKRLEEATDKLEGSSDHQRELDLRVVGDVMDEDPLFKELVVQRSRRYVKDSIEQSSRNQILFPVRAPPQLATYTVKKTYGTLLDKIEESFSKTEPLFRLSVYNPYMHYIGPEEDRDPFLVSRHMQIVRLIRLGFLKRFESSAKAFEMSCRTIMYKLLAWIDVHAETAAESDKLERWKRKNSEILNYIYDFEKDLFDDGQDEPEEDVVPPEFVDAATERKLEPDSFNISAILSDAYEDLESLVDFLEETQKVTAEKDDKLKSLVKLLRTDAVLKYHKVIIFTEFKTTARYLFEQLRQQGFKGVDVIDSSTSENRASLIQRFSPYYNSSSSAELADEGRDEIRILISTDVLAEGLNLQDCTRLINYDIHWNPVRLMQRIGRIDRRMNPGLEAKIIADHPNTKELRGTAAYWNFLPPGELDRLLALHKRVAGKTLRISKALGLEGGKLLKPDDDFDDLKDFDEQYEGQKSFDEELHLEYEKLLLDNPELDDRIRAYPGKMFSGRETPEAGVTGVFFCYALPAMRSLGEGEVIDSETERWSTKLGGVEWYFVKLDDEEIIREPRRIASLIRSDETVKRTTSVPKTKLVELRKKVEREIKNDYLRRMGAPAGVKPELCAWMEVS